MYLCADRQREKEEVVYVPIRTHTYAHTQIYMYTHAYTHMCVYAYVFTQLNPVFFSLALFAAVRRGEALVSRGTGGVPCPPQPLHRPK